MQSIGIKIDGHSDEQIKIGAEEILNADSYVTEIYNFLAFTNLNKFDDVIIKLKSLKEKN